MHQLALIKILLDESMRRNGKMNCVRRGANSEKMHEIHNPEILSSLVYSIRKSHVMTMFS